jgi:hypothetical protein
MVCQMTSLTALGIYDWFYAGRPFPSRLQGSAAKCNSAQRALAVALGNCAEQATKFGILDIECVLPVWKASDQPILIRRRLSRLEFYLQFERRLDHLVDTEPGEPKVVPLLRLLWSRYLPDHLGAA